MQKSRNGISILVLIIILLVLIILGGVGAYFYISKSEESVQTQQEIGKIKTPDITQLEKVKDVEKISQMGPLYPLSPFTVNLRSKKGMVYLKVKLDFELSIKELKNELDAKNAVIRDAVIRILTSKSLEDLSNDEGKEVAADEIINDINAMLHDGYIKNVYFTEFIVQ
jgi:flagellar FliL protein